MKKKLSLLIIFLVSIFAFTTNVFAIELANDGSGEMYLNKSELEAYGMPSNSSVSNCRSLNTSLFSAENSGDGCKISAVKNAKGAAKLQVSFFSGTYKNAIKIDVTVKDAESTTDDTTLVNVADALQICDANESPKIVASFRLVGIFVTIIKIIAPIVIIIMGMFEMSKAVIEGKDDSIKKQALSFLRRAIACVLIFFVPSIILALFHYIDGWDNVKGQFSTCMDCILGSKSCPNVGFGTPQIGDEALKGHNGMPSDVELNMYKNK